MYVIDKNVWNKVHNFNLIFVFRYEISYINLGKHPPSSKAVQETLGTLLYL